MPIIDVTDPYNASGSSAGRSTVTAGPDLSTNKDGTRLYAGQPGNFGVAPNNSSFGRTGW